MTELIAKGYGSPEKKTSSLMIWGDCQIRYENRKKECMIHAAAAAESLQSCPTLCNPIDGSPPGSSVPGILQARMLEHTFIYTNTVVYLQCTSSTQ